MLCLDCINCSGEILGNYEAAKVGFGAGKNMKTSIARVVYDCPFVDGGIKVKKSTLSNCIGITAFLHLIKGDFLDKLINHRLFFLSS
ncbi:hypothetical protein Syun_010281 [Stephania yunnanensis]|uniref:Uncharacterized protein n=1 Tax=Stephania yunnanensis TaxID=152371 RepID=A0AAP0PPU8_9MAGN